MANQESPTAALLGEAIRLHRTGALVEAVARYREVLRLDAANPDAHYYLAVAAQQQGDFQQAFDLVQRLLALDPNAARGHRLLGSLQTRRGAVNEALASYDRAIALDPALAEAHGARADLLSQLGRLDDAVLGYDRALAIQPGSIGDWCNRGAALVDLGRYDEALDSYARALAVRPDFPEALYGRGNVLAKLQRFEEALADYDKVLAARPGFVDALNNKANCLLKLSRFEEAAAAVDAALAIDPRHMDALVTSGTVYYRLGQPAEALRRADRALAINPNSVEALVNRDSALQNLNRYEEALATLRRILVLKPGDPETSLKISLASLMLGRLGEGWSHYHRRWQVMGVPRRPYPQPAWRGERVNGTLLVWGDQGLGDQIIYAGMLPELAGKADEIVVEVEPRLVPLFERSFQGIKAVPLVPSTPYGGRVDAQIALGDLGALLRPRMDSFPARSSGYIAADSARAAAFRARLAQDGRKVVGLSWISRAQTGKFKSAELRDLEVLLRTPGLRFVDLQYGDTLDERQMIERELGCRVERLPDLDTTADIDGLAALIAACDAVVTVSNVTAHLAGSVGTPTWVIVPFGLGRIWYWFTEGDKSPWYPRVRMLRQDAGEPWRDLFAAAAQEIGRI